MNEQPDRPPIITLTTDFGLADHYVGTVKGVLLQHCPGATLVDISHQIAPFSVIEGGYAIAQAWKHFPSGTVHLVVVDPGVGTSRRAAIVEAEGHIFVAPDNGVLGMVLSDPAYEAVEITKLPALTYLRSQTFHGRDVFAVVAGQLASGMAKPEDFGPRIERLANGIAFPEKQTERGSEGMVLSIDRFGNVVTNFSADVHSRLPEKPFRIEGGKAPVKAFYETFGLAPQKVVFAYFGSSGFVEMAVNQGSAAEALQVKVGDSLTLVELEL